MKLLVTRPLEDAGPLAQLLEARRHSVIVDPLLTIRFLDTPLPPTEAMGSLLFTSTNGVRAWCRASASRNHACWAVGDRTARALAEAGFAAVRSAGGDVAALIRLVEETADASHQPILHVTGSERTGDVARRLGDRGIAVDTIVLYEAVQAGRLGSATRAALEAGEIDGVLLYSPRTAAIFARLLREEDPTLLRRPLLAFCLSAAVAEPLAGLDALAPRVASSPDQAALLDLVQSCGPPTVALATSEERVSG